MRILKTLFGNISLDVNNLVDNIITTDEERITLKTKLKEILKQAESSAQEQVTRRWEADAKAGWLPANIRPLTLAFLVVSTVILIFIEGGLIDFIDTQLKYGSRYTYEIYAYNFVMGNEYEYRSLAVSRSVTEDCVELIDVLTNQPVEPRVNYQTKENQITKGTTLIPLGKKYKYIAEFDIVRDRSGFVPVPIR